MSGSLETLGASLERYRRGQLRTHEFTALWRHEAATLATLPPAFGEVLEGILMRLESSSLFTEESCSFSREDLLANLDVWLAKARGRLEAG
jgi:hypothetical protein